MPGRLAHSSHRSQFLSTRYGDQNGSSLVAVFRNDKFTKCNKQNEANQSRH